MNEILERIKAQPEDNVEMFDFADKSVDLLETIRYREYKEEKAIKQKLRIEKKEERRISKDYTVVDYLLMYLILFVFIGISTVIVLLFF